MEDVGINILPAPSFGIISSDKTASLIDTPVLVLAVAINGTATHCVIAQAKKAPGAHVCAVVTG